MPLGKFSPGEMLVTCYLFDKTYQPKKKKEKRKMTEVAERSSQYKNIESVLGGTLKALSKCTSKCPSARGLNWTCSFEILPAPRLSKTWACEIPERKKKLKFKCWVRNECQRSSPAWLFSRKAHSDVLNCAICMKFYINRCNVAVYSAIIELLFNVEVQRLKFTQKIYLCTTQNKTVSIETS